jgi:hypothetical protein
MHLDWSIEINEHGSSNALGLTSRLGVPCHLLLYRGFKAESGDAWKKKYIVTFQERIQWVKDVKYKSMFACEP